MYIHKEGYTISACSAGIAGGLIYVLYAINVPNFLFYLITTALVLSTIAVISFFRIPKRKFVFDEKKIVCPADGKVVVIETVFEDEFLKKDCYQISVFMSPANVHVNRYSISGKILYYKYHKGSYFVASKPKASSDNERTTVCLETQTGVQIIERQIAGALARRIVCYAKEGQEVKQNDELGFIKFGSRIDILIPLSSKINVKLGDKVQYGITVLAELE